MRVDIITIFPEVFSPVLNESVIGRAQTSGLVEINTIDLRDFTNDPRRSVDDKPYGGGPGMLMKPEPIFAAVEKLKQQDSKIVLTSPQGRCFNQKTAEKLSCETHLIMICGHYEGVDERVRKIVDIEISIGDFVLTNGNLPAMVIVDAVTRLIKGVLGSPESKVEESFADELLEYPQYTRPPVFREMKVPEILLSGNHEAIAEWRKSQAIKRTQERRPNLYASYIKKRKNSGENRS